VAVPAAAVAGLLLGLGLGSVGGRAPSPQPPPAPIASAPLAALSPTAAGTGGEVRLVAAADSRTLVIEVTDPGGEPEGGYFEAWLMGDGSTRLYSLGALTPQDGGDRFTGTFGLPDDLPLDQFDTVDVSAEHYDGDPTHSGESLLRGTL
jgi:Anti-sigma-K factor rskA, C-terminal